MQTAVPSDMLMRHEMLADAMGETIAELRMIEAGDLIAYIRAEQWANIADLVQSSAELSFEDGTVSFAYFADYTMSWGEGPSIALDMEFQASELTIFFTLTIGPHDSAVRIKDVLFASSQASEPSATQTFARALDAARRGARVAGLDLESRR